MFKSIETRPVSQEHPMGCGVACVAFRLGRSYQRAHSLFEFREYAWTRGYYCREIVEALARAGLEYEFKKYDPVKHGCLLDKQGTIVFVEPCIRYPSGHYLIRSRAGWMNPWLNFPTMNPVKAKFQKELPGKISHLMFENPAR